MRLGEPGARERKTGSSGVPSPFVSTTLAYVGLLVLQVGLFAAVFVGTVAERYLMTAWPPLVVGLAGGSHDHGAILVAGRMASSASVLAVVSVVWLADRQHHADRTDTAALPAQR